MTISMRLLVLNGIVFFFQFSANPMLLEWFALWPAGGPEYAPFQGQMVAVPQFYPWQLLTYGFLHGSISHLFFNMLALGMFGPRVEAYMGSRRFLTYYLTCLIGAGLIQLVVASTSDMVYPTVGASGAIFGILLAFGLFFPNHIIMLIIPPIPMKAKWFVLVFGGIELLMGVTGVMPQVAHFAHLGGMLFGFLLLLYWGRGGRRGRQ
ncbi:MAG: rhomboid family intramembrane serine protease [Wenzhouxiangellaceae bacterium]